MLSKLHSLSFPLHLTSAYSKALYALTSPILTSSHRTQYKIPQNQEKKRSHTLLGFRMMIDRSIDRGIFHEASRNLSTGEVQPSTLNQSSLKPARFSATLSPQHLSGYCKSDAHKVPDKKTVLDFPLGSICFLYDNVHSSA